MLNLSNIYSIARGVYHGSWYTLYIVGFQYGCIDNNDRVEYYCVPHTIGEKLFRKRISTIRYRKDGTPFFIANKHRVSFDNVFRIDSKVWR
jgi:hypothetical protein